MPTNAAAVIFQKASELGASDVHIAVGTPLMFRIDGELIAQTVEKMTDDQVGQIVRMVLGTEDNKMLLEAKEVDTAFEVNPALRLRVNCHYERGHMGLVARIIPNIIPPLDQLGLDE